MKNGIGRYVRRVAIDPTYSLTSGIRNFGCESNSTSGCANSKLNLVELDNKWRQKWQEERLNDVTSPSTSGEINTRRKMFILPMFPYPSGDLHLGHLRVYSISDVLARFHRMQGKDVIHPIGWDAFGLPAENAAIERGIHPRVWTKQNIGRMRTQLEEMNGHWDWNREFATCDPDFYKHTQKLFTLLHKAGLAYQAESTVNYDPIDHTVLANEQVDSNGISWRSGAKIEKKILKQWFFKISEYRQELLDDLSLLEKGGTWPENVLAMQKNWLGKSTGAQIKFSVISYDKAAHADIVVFTSRPDTLYGVQYLALAPTHPIVKRIAHTDAKLKDFLNNLPTLALDSKVGYLLPSIRGINPLTYEDSTPDATKASLPIFVAPYVLGDYGDGAVMGVPGHDVRDHAFWRYNHPDGPIRFVISGKPNGLVPAWRKTPLISHGFLTSHNGPYAKMKTTDAAIKILNLLKSRGRGSPAEAWRLRDWLVSRQRFWGTPIPIIHCNNCGPVSVPDEQLPVELPVVSHWQKGKVGNPLEHAHDWISVQCPSCGSAAKRDTDTMDTFVDSSWYFMRFLDPSNEKDLFSPEAANAKLPVDIYVGGVEHAILHLLYARFISKFLSDTYLWPYGRKISGEPFKVLLAQGMVHGITYTNPTNERFLKPNEINLQNPRRPVVISSGEIANISYEKMSKSKYNGVDPSACRKKYGADAMRAHILFQAPITEILEWDEEKITGITRWLRRLHNYISHERETWITADSFEYLNAGCPKDLLGKLMQTKGNGTDNFTPSSTPNVGNALVMKADVAAQNDKLIYAEQGTLPNIGFDLEQLKRLWRATQGTVLKVTSSYSETYSLNTVVSDLMILTNVILESSEKQRNETMMGSSFVPQKFIHWSLKELIKMMAPITPAFAEDCWAMLQPQTISQKSVCNNIWGRPPPKDSCDTHQLLGSHESVFTQSFPTPDGSYKMLTPDTQKCAVQVNGRLRVVVEIPAVPGDLKGIELEHWITEEILNTAQGKEKLLGRNGVADNPALLKKQDSQDFDIRIAKKVIVVRGGKTVNYVV